MRPSASSAESSRAWSLPLLLGLGVVSLGAGQQPHFVQHTIATHLAGGYQVVVSDLNQDGKPDLIAVASGMPELVWFENPGWPRSG